jgi:hypothetical protein
MMTRRAKTAPSGAASTIIQRTSSKEHLQATGCAPGLHPRPSLSGVARDPDDPCNRTLTLRLVRPRHQSRLARGVRDERHALPGP